MQQLTEASPLLRSNAGEEAEEILPKTNLQILKYIVDTAYPIATALVLEVMCNFISLFFASRVHSNIAPGIIFAGVSLSTMFANVTCFSFHEGMTGAVETLGSQANGAGDFRKVGIVLMRCIVVLYVVTVPLLVTWVYVDDIFRYVGVADEICDVVETFLMVCILYLYKSIIFCCCCQYCVGLYSLSPVVGPDVRDPIRYYRDFIRQIFDVCWSRRASHVLSGIL
jgi:Na+-driven multidrug efflux pump